MAAATHRQMGAEKQQRTVNGGEDGVPPPVGFLRLAVMNPTLREVGKDKFYTFEVLTQVDPMRMQGLELFNAAAQTVSVQRSYSEFELLSDQLRSSFAYRKDSKKYVPKLPPTLFYLNDRRLEERRLALHRFLHQVASSELLRGEKWLAQFLQLDRRIDDSPPPVLPPACFSFLQYMTVRMLDQMLGRMLSEMELDDFKRRMDDTQADGMVRLAQRRHDFDMHSDRMLKLSIAAFQNPRQFNEVVGRVYNREIAVGDECGAPTTDVFGQQEDDEVEQMLAQFDECQMERVATVHKAIRNLTAKLKCPVARLYYVQVQLKRAPVKKVVENGERKEARELVVAEEESQADGLEAGRREEEADGGEGARGRNVNEEEASNTYEFFINGVTKNIIANKFSLKFVVQQC